MSLAFNIEFTGDDRIRFEPKIRNNDFLGIRVKYQTAKKLEKVNYSITGFEPFFEYEWLTVVKYENLKGDAVKDLMKPTPVSFSPHGLHVKESWGKMDNQAFIKKIMEDMKRWIEFRIKYDETLPPIDSERQHIGDSTLARSTNFINFIFDFKNHDAVAAFNNIYIGQTLIPIPEPEEDDWILEQNSVAANRIEKRAHKGDPDILQFGPFKALTYQRSGEEQ